MIAGNHKMSVFARFFSMVFRFGPVTAIAIYAVLGTTGLFALRGCVRFLSGYLSPQSRNYGTAAVTATLPAFELKPLVVFDAGIEIFPSSDNEMDRRFPGLERLLPMSEKALLEFEYQGHADYVVDMSSKSIVITNSVDATTGHQTIHIFVPRPYVSNIRYDNAPSTNRWLMTWGTDKSWRDYYRNNHEKLIYGAISRTAHDKKVREMAETQTREIIRRFVAPFVDDPDKDIVINWKD